nr:hypothetical protein [Candidatus Njordarchaeota archaeon]
MDVSEDIREIKSILERMEAIIDSRLIGIEDPAEDEVAEIEDYEKMKREGKIELHDISRVPREKSGETTRKPNSGKPQKSN